MIANLRMTIQESLRYRGRLGHWSWVAHRVSGVAILFFLLIHVWEGSMLTFNPDFYEWSTTVFKHPFFSMGEIVVFGSVLYHAFNGLRITLLDFKPEWWHYQNKSSQIVWGIFLIMFIPLALRMLFGVVENCQHPHWPAVAEEHQPDSCWAFPAREIFDGP